ncbi:glycosyltransferase [Amycolatopsis roodepoortensis]|uniref:Chloroorienticin B synthase/vancomycin aglycone glucosyltransferase n=1 Tax=Amycolatopsis roodepoortensis TaxID=700274 RepID=A0ABR9LHI8_9PSEU|nr:glycosyltransferase [Amycolatopsis roodepoortensis]MBE1579760.1 chloroorienticin B synthase/vancomycin aglycone glucosyltransferase [Amycolatopsis roodepoortensis]
MRVLFWSYGTRGEVEPLVALALRLREQGDEVRMCAPPDYTGRLAEVGVPHVVVGKPVLEEAGKLGGPPESPEAAIAGIAEQFDKIPAAAEGCDAVVATGLLSGAIGVRSVAEKLGIPYFYVVPSPALVPSPEHRGMYNNGADGMFGGALNELRASIGLPPVKNLYDFSTTDKPLLAADPLLAPAAGVQTGAWIHADDRPLSAELEAFLEAGPAPVYVGFGCSPAPDGVAKVAVEAIRAQGRRVVLSHGWAGLTLPDDGGDCLAVGEENLQALFGRVAAAVHHGGTGTTHVAALAGVPQIVVPQIADHPHFAAKVAELGIGVAHDGSNPTVDSLSAALVTALTPETAARAKTVAGTIRTDGTTVAADLVRAAVTR